VTVVLLAATVHYAVAWRQGDDIRLPGGRAVRRFPCSSYRLPPGDWGSFEAYAVIDGAAQAAQSSSKEAVKALVDAVFDRELPMVRCGNSLRRQVADAEWRFRQKGQPPIAESTFVNVANGMLARAVAPAWARVNIDELHLLRTRAWPMLPRFIGTVGSYRQLSEQMSPVEAIFVAMSLGQLMMSDSDDFRDGPAAYVQRTRERELHPPAPGARLRVSVAAFEIDDLNVQGTVLSTSAQRFLSQLILPQ
jgi:hypothetical protein